MPSEDTSPPCVGPALVAPMQHSPPTATKCTKPAPAPVSATVASTFSSTLGGSSPTTDKSSAPRHAAMGSLVRAGAKEKKKPVMHSPRHRQRCYTRGRARGGYICVRLRGTGTAARRGRLYSAEITSRSRGRLYLTLPHSTTLRAHRGGERPGAGPTMLQKRASSIEETSVSALRHRRTRRVAIARQVAHLLQSS